MVAFGSNLFPSGVCSLNQNKESLAVPKNKNPVKAAVEKPIRAHRQDLDFGGAVFTAETDVVPSSDFEWDVDMEKQVLETGISWSLPSKANRSEQV